jgi:omega-6 fatty acid desaturase (delta-12 desaturase)
MSPAMGGISLRELRALLPSHARERSSRRGVAIFLTVACAYLGTFVGALLTSGGPLALGLSTLNGLVIAILFVVGHDACHGALTPSTRLNHWLGRLAFLPSLHPFAAWEYSHNARHHGWTNLRSMDPSYAPHSKAEYEAMSPARRWLERVYRSPQGIGLYYLVEIWWKQEFHPRAEELSKPGLRRSFSFDRGLVVAFVGVQVAAVLVACWLRGSLEPSAVAARLTLHIAWPFALWNWVVGFVTLPHHTHAAVPWFDRREEWSFYLGQVRGTVHVPFPRWIGRLLHNIMEHTAHHVDPKIPLYHLPESQQALVQALGAEIQVQPWSVRWVLELYRTCKLYDFHQHCWLDFQGRVTAKVPIPGGAAARAGQTSSAAQRAAASGSSED